MNPAASCPAHDPDSAKILCGKKDTAHTADLYRVQSVGIPARVAGLTLRPGHTPAAPCWGYLQCPALTLAILGVLGLL